MEWHGLDHGGAHSPHATQLSQCCFFSAGSIAESACFMATSSWSSKALHRLAGSVASTLRCKALNMRLDIER